MEKISGILRGSPRVTSVDLKDAAPVRPGTPSFGRPEGISTAAESAKLSRSSTGARSPQSNWMTKEEQHSQIAASVADRFFLKNKQEAPLRESLKAEMAVAKPAPEEFVEYEEVPMEEVTSLETDSQWENPEGLYPKGSFIDFSA